MPRRARSAARRAPRGTFNVVVTASDGVNSDSADSSGRSTQGAPLRARPAAAAGAGRGRQRRQLTASVTGGAACSTSWDFGDGTPVTRVLVRRRRSRTCSREPGIYYVTVTARDAAGYEQRRTIVADACTCRRPRTAPAMSGNIAFEDRATAAPTGCGSSTRTTTRSACSTPSTHAKLARDQRSARRRARSPSRRTARSG